MRMIWEHTALTGPSPLMAETMFKLNPWWRFATSPEVPETRRHLTLQIQNALSGTRKPIILICGPLQTGKTTACLQVISDLMKKGVSPKHIFRLRFDAEFKEIMNSVSLLTWVKWYEKFILDQSFHEVAKKNKKCYLLFDEVQNHFDWAAQLDFISEHYKACRILITGSMNLSVDKNLTNLNRRIHQIEAGAMSLTEIGAFRELLTPQPFLGIRNAKAMCNLEFWKNLNTYAKIHAEFVEQAYKAYALRGAFPFAHLRPELNWEELMEEFDFNIGRQLLPHFWEAPHSIKKIHTKQLIDTVFQICCDCAGQTVNIRALYRELRKKLKHPTESKVMPRISKYLDFLEENRIIRRVSPLNKPRNGGPYFKICLVDHSLISWGIKQKTPVHFYKDHHYGLQNGKMGFWAENIVANVFSGINGLNLYYQHSGNKYSEVDFVLSIGKQYIPVEVKFRTKIEEKQFDGVLRFMRGKKSRAPFGLMITKTERPSKLPNIETVPLKHLMLLR